MADGTFVFFWDLPPRLGLGYRREGAVVATAAAAAAAGYRA